ncbi:hypothetical protein ACJX0J_017121, partial [Zea mays]
MGGATWHAKNNLSALDCLLGGDRVKSALLGGDRVKSAEEEEEEAHKKNMLRQILCMNFLHLALCVHTLLFMNLGGQILEILTRSKTTNIININRLFLQQMLLSLNLYDFSERMNETAVLERICSVTEELKFFYYQYNYLFNNHAGKCFF